MKKCSEEIYKRIKDVVNTVLQETTRTHCISFTQERLTEGFCSDLKEFKLGR